MEVQMAAKLAGRAAESHTHTKLNGNKKAQTEPTANETEPKRRPNGGHMMPKWCPNGAQIVLKLPNDAQMVPKWCPNCVGMDLK